MFCKNYEDAYRRVKRSVRRGIVSMFAAALLVSPLTVYADDFRGESGWKVAFTAGSEMRSNFTSNKMAEAVAGLQPGDSIVFKVALENQNNNQTEWYMTNEVLYSLEDRSRNGGTSGGAYEYELVYIDRNNDRTVLFSSDTVGGEAPSAAGEGLHEATDALEDYFYLDTLSKGQAGRIELMVGLDGETQGNDYQDTLADLRMNFAVTSVPTPSRTPRPTPEHPGDPDETIPDEPVPGDPWIVRTGDYRDFTGPAAYMSIAGIGLAIMAVWSLIDRKKGGGAS